MALFESWDWSDTWLSVLVAVVVAAAIGGGIMLFSTKNVDYYYISRGSSSQTPSTCVYAHWTWQVDEVAFCTDDGMKAVDFTSKANAALKGK